MAEMGRIKQTTFLERVGSVSWPTRIFRAKYAATRPSLPRDYRYFVKVQTARVVKHFLKPTNFDTTFGQIHPGRNRGDKLRRETVVRKLI